MQSWKKQLPMWATHSRSASGLLLLALYEMPLNQAAIAWAASVVFILASITDWLDGYWARKFDAVSNMGQLMDPIADKILVTAALLILVREQALGAFVPFLLLARDLFIGGLRSVAASNLMVIAAKPLGKWKTALQMVAVPCLFIGGVLPKPLLDLGLSLTPLGLTLIWVSLILSLVSGLQYLVGYLQAVKAAP